MSQKANQKKATTKVNAGKPQAKQVPIKPEDFNPKNLKFTPFVEFEKVKNQYLSFPKYDNKKGGNEAVFITDWFHMETYGIPSNPDYIKAESDKEKIKIPLNPDGQTPNLAFIKMLDALDECAKKSVSACFSDAKCELNPKLKKALAAAPLDYSALHKQPQGSLTDLVNDDSEGSEADADNTAAKKKPDYFTVKFDKDFESGNITTAIYVTEVDPNDTTKDLPPKRKTLTSIYEIEKLITWRCKIRMVIKLAKMWTKKILEKKGELACGLTFKVKQIEIKPSSETKEASDKENFMDYAFGTNDDAEATTTAKTEDVENISEEEGAPEGNVVDENSISSESDEQEDPEPEPVVEEPKAPVKVAKKSPIKKAAK